MNIRSKKLWAGTLAAGITGTLGLGFVTSSAPAESGERGTPTIQMTMNGNQLEFTGADTVTRGSSLTIVNNTDPEVVGPHTFTLVKQKLIPDSNKEVKACFKGERESVCRKVYKAHEVNFQTGKVGKKFVDSGQVGWNSRFRERGIGDSWVAERENARRSAVVSARAGKTLPYFCVIHPEMRGSIDVVSPTR